MCMQIIYINIIAAFTYMQTISIITVHPNQVHE